jgi:hypothetical protein
MKTFKKDHLPETIIHNGETYTYNRNLTVGWERNNTDLKFISRELKKDNNRKAVLVHVLAKNLRGKLDIHNKPYQPTKWIFST